MSRHDRDEDVDMRRSNRGTYALILLIFVAIWAVSMIAVSNPNSLEHLLSNTPATPNPLFAVDVQATQTQDAWLNATALPINCAYATPNYNGIDLCATAVPAFDVRATARPSTFQDFLLATDYVVSSDGFGAIIKADDGQKYWLNQNGLRTRIEE